MKGFTLIEVLLAIVVFSLIAAVTGTVLGPAGEGFMMLKESRQQLEEQQWVGKQLRRDISYLSRSEDKNIPSVVVTNDSRGDTDFDELYLLVRDPMYPGLTQVHYFIDEESQLLKREAKSAWSRSYVEPISWDLATLESFAVEVFNPRSGWTSAWNELKPPYTLPLAFRITVRDNKGDMQWDMPVLLR